MMNVSAKVDLPKEVAVEVVIRATLGELEELRVLVARSGWTPLGDRLLRAIDAVGRRVRVVAESAVDADRVEVLEGGD